MNILLKFYLCLAGSVVLHELAHYIFARLCGMKNIQLYLGDEFFRIHLGTIHFSPLLVDGRVEFETPSRPISLKRLALIYHSGPGMNALIATLSFVGWMVLPTVYVFPMLFFINSCLLAWGIIPIKGARNDFGEYRKDKRTALVK